MSDKIIADSGNVEEERQNLMETTPKGTKSKKSKKWKKKFSRGESSSVQEKLAKNEDDCSKVQDRGEDEKSSRPKEEKTDNEDKEIPKERRKSIKGRITGKLRKLSKTEKKVYSELKQDEENADNKIEEKKDVVLEEEKETEVVESQKESQGEEKILPKIEVEGTEEENLDVNKETLPTDGVQQGEDTAAGKVEHKIEKKDEKEKIGNENGNDAEQEVMNVESDIENHVFETSVEQRKIEDEERRKSKEMFDAVVCELNINNKIGGAGDTKIEKEETEKEETEKEEEEHSDGGDEKKLTEENVAESPLTLLKMSALSKPEDYNENKDSCKEKETENKDLDNNSEKGDREIDITDDGNGNEDKGNENEVAENKSEAGKSEKKAEKVLSPTKEENNELSQKIARKAVGKVCSKYRQVQITRTYCTQCCTVM